MKSFEITQTNSYQYRTRKERTIVAMVYDADGELIDAVFPGVGAHKSTFDWAQWRAESIPADYPDAAHVDVYCGDDLIAKIEYMEKPANDGDAVMPAEDWAVAGAVADFIEKEFAMELTRMAALAGVDIITDRELNAYIDGRARVLTDAILRQTYFRLDRGPLLRLLSRHALANIVNTYN